MTNADKWKEFVEWWGEYQRISNPFCSAEILTGNINKEIAHLRRKIEYLQKGDNAKQ